MALSIGLYIPQRSNAGRVIKDMFSLYRHLSEVELPRFIWHRVTINFDSSHMTSLLSMICTQASFFVPCRFTYDRPIRRYCKTKMKYLRLSFCSMNYQDCYLHYPNNPILVRYQVFAYYWLRCSSFFHCAYTLVAINKVI